MVVAMEKTALPAPGPVAETPVLATAPVVGLRVVERPLPGDIPPAVTGKEPTRPVTPQTDVDGVFVFGPIVLAGLVLPVTRRQVAPPVDPPFGSRKVVVPVEKPQILQGRPVI